MVSHIKDPKVINAWSGYSLDQRAVMLHRAFPETHVSGSTIHKVYKDNKIKRKVVVIKKFSNLKTERKIKE